MLVYKFGLYVGVARINKPRDNWHGSLLRDMEEDLFSSDDNVESEDVSLPRGTIL